jgi:hypothetical protein
VTQLAATRSRYINQWHRWRQKQKNFVQSHKSLVQTDEVIEVTLSNLAVNYITGSHYNKNNYNS